ncbi:class I SAM-dependent methyltransferase [Actinomadura sp. ATCC 31491]|uniref:Class I SAM-dependent methyltransferase n=1 Tax=Actinomadura luzonensis TaxID=2805427 RepID=A0ABT0GBW8_9ACTN|nr:class I SAM-dependent methyltransferase [Actinomadura luzonensis]MCK2221898.1 class I SAM-dependent methyltransferase [Actinomadura luzonensis]
MEEDAVVRTTAAYDGIAPVFAERNERPGEPFLAFRGRFAAALPPGPVADLGCGPGRDATWFRGRGLRALGVDRSAGMARVAADRGVPVVLGDLRRPPLAPGSLAGLWSVAALLHVPAADTGPTLRAWAAALRPGGVLGLSTSAGDGEGWEFQGHGTELVRYYVHRTPDALLAALDAAGFEVTEHGLSTGHRTWLSVLAVRREV